MDKNALKLLVISVLVPPRQGSHLKRWKALPRRCRALAPPLLSSSPAVSISSLSPRSLKVEEEAYKAFVSSGGVCEQRWWFGIDDCIRKDVLLMKINGVDPVTFEPIQRESDASVPTPQSSQELDQNSPVH
ncbi:hypothetical protein YC2023_078826 [Brassica napus]